MIQQKFFVDPSKTFAKSMAQMANLWSSKDIREGKSYFQRKLLIRFNKSLVMKDPRTIFKSFRYLQYLQYVISPGAE